MTAHQRRRVEVMPVWEPRPAFFDNANCRSVPTDVFFVDGDRGPLQQVQEARGICASCTVAVECLEYALRLPTPWYGIYAGLTVNQRKQLKRVNNERTVVI